MGHYSRGANFERRVKKYYEDKGFLVLRSAGSHSPIDLFAMRQGEFIAIQVTIDKSRKTQAGLAQLLEIARENGCQAILAYRDNREIAIKELLKQEGNNDLQQM